MHDIVKRSFVFPLLAILASPAFAQNPATAPPGTANVEVDPIRCWWRTSAGAVRIGEPFDLSLTCAVLENEAVQVVPDESRLGNAVIQMAPFEVVSGVHPADLHSAERRFFQYEYRLRIINTDVIGKDVPIPALTIHYRVNSQIAANTALQGRDLVYVLPPQSIRITSMVPADAPDIRDTAGARFADVEALDFKAGVFEIVGIALVAIGALMTLLVLVRLARGTRRRTPADQRTLDTYAVAGTAVRELSAVQREREQQGWTAPVIDRALAATRVAAACAIGRPVNQRAVDAGTQPGEGALVARGARRGKRRTLSAAVTAQDLGQTISGLDAGSPTRAVLEPLRTALVAFGEAQYGRGAPPARTADARLDEVLSAARTAAGRIQSAHLWPKPWLRRWRAGEAAMDTRA
jgi:hypothetical protein